MRKGAYGYEETGVPVMRKGAGLLARDDLDFFHGVLVGAGLGTALWACIIALWVWA